MSLITAYGHAIKFCLELHRVQVQEELHDWRAIIPLWFHMNIHLCHSYTLYFIYIYTLFVVLSISVVN